MRQAHFGCRRWRFNGPYKSAARDRRATTPAASPRRGFQLLHLSVPSTACSPRRRATCRWLLETAQAAVDGLRTKDWAARWGAAAARAPAPSPAARRLLHLPASRRPRARRPGQGAADAAELGLALPHPVARPAARPRRPTVLASWSEAPAEAGGTTRPTAPTSSSPSSSCASTLCAAHQLASRCSRPVNARAVPNVRGADSRARTALLSRRSCAMRAGSGCTTFPPSPLFYRRSRRRCARPVRTTTRSPRPPDVGSELRHHHQEVSMDTQTSPTNIFLASRLPVSSPSSSADVVNLESAHRDRRPRDARVLVRVIVRHFVVARATAALTPLDDETNHAGRRLQLSRSPNVIAKLPRSTTARGERRGRTLATDARRRRAWRTPRAPPARTPPEVSTSICQYRERDEACVEGADAGRLGICVVRAPNVQRRGPLPMRDRKHLRELKRRGAMRRWFSSVRPASA